MKLIVNLPAFNEEEKIGETIKNIPRTLAGIDEVFIQVIDDGSKDQTATICRKEGAHLVFSHELNRGIGITFRTAVEKALENEADIMLNIDADGQFDPKDIPKLIEPILKGRADIVSTDRFGKHEAKNIPYLKNILNRFAALLIGKFLNHRINDLTCGFRAYNREALLRLNLPGGFTYTQEVLIDAIGKDLKVVWVPIEVTYFSGRKSSVTGSVYRYINNSAKIILKAVRDVRPMKFFGGPGLILIVISFSIFIFFAIMYFQEFKITPFRNYLLLAVTLLLIGMQFLIFALIADMIKSNRKLTEDQMYLMKKEKYRK
ncbi:MAG: glycosyltransferase family 2 protein [bacterium]|nr:glycosyltransferase family 2 protein [bacterium]